MSIYVISDTHFFHDREFIWKVRGFKSVEAMNRAIIRNWNAIISNNDDVYMLGDFFLGSDLNRIDEIINQLHGKIHLVIGNHDTNRKVEHYKHVDKIVEMGYALKIEYKHRQILFSHYPTITSTLESDPKHAVLNIHGHIHTKSKFYEGRPYMYNVSCDTQNCRPVPIDDILQDINREISDCLATVKDDE